MSNNISSRDAILSRIRAGKPRSYAAPDVPQYKWPGDPIENFQRQLKAFDGNYIMFNSREEALEWLKNNLPKGKEICSAVADFRGSSTPDDYPDPHKCTNIDICVAEGLLGIGEMGSVLVTDKSLGKPACALLCTDLYLLLDKSKIVDGVHTAYHQINLGDASYSCFFSGPSATADIEAVHITGAQAEISLTVLLY